MSNKPQSPISKTIEVGKFYFIHDKSHSGHPGFVVWKDDEKNRYLVIRFDSDKFGIEFTKEQRNVKHITKLSRATSAKVMNSYVHNRPMLCKRKDIGILLPDLSIHYSDKNLIDEISRRNPELSGSLKK